MSAGYIPNSVVRHTLQIHKPRPPDKPKTNEFHASDRLRAVTCCIQWMSLWGGASTRFSSVSHVSIIIVATLYFPRYWI